MSVKTLETKTMRVIIADDHELIRKAMAVVFQKLPNARIVGEAGNGEEALKIFERGGIAHNRDKHVHLRSDVARAARKPRAFPNQIIRPCACTIPNNEREPRLEQVPAHRLAHQSESN